MGNLVIENILKKSELAASGEDHDYIRPLLLILGGANRGVCAAAACYALHLLRLESVFDIVVGVSGGAWVGAYFLAGKEQIRRGISIYYQEFASENYISFWRFPRVLDFSLAERAALFGAKKLDIQAVLASKSDFFVGVTDKEGKGKFINAKEFPLLKSLFASSATPLGKCPVSINGNDYFDGGIGFCFPVREIIEHFQPTDILVLPNVPANFSKNISIFERLMMPLFRLPKRVRKRALARYGDFCEGVEFAEKLANIDIVWPLDLGVGPFTTDTRKLWVAAESSVEQVLQRFGRPDLKFKLY
ncbi:hypothetical protein HYW53_02710 [Candidatus Giovannonibacteria bacterium]|nr:hypothetical protein [Candidatus Giovannonibacteria bacterium]